MPSDIWESESSDKNLLMLVQGSSLVELSTIMGFKAAERIFMPFFSIVVPAYKNEAYLPDCLDSIQSQSFRDWEAVVVVDGSPDCSSAIVRDYAQGDPRFILIDKTINEGTHRARMSGVEVATGEFIYLLDADDKLPPTALERLHEVISANSEHDVFHYGINVIGVDVSEDERTAFEDYINLDCGVLRGHEILDYACSAEKGYLQDWRVTQRVYSSSLLKDAFARMTKDRLGRAQDGYEFFVIASLACSQLTCNDITALDYFYGRGINGNKKMSQEKFLNSARDFQVCIDAIRQYAAPHAWMSESCDGSADKLVELLMNDWHIRLSDQDKLAVLNDLASIIGAEALSIELMRFVRDDAYALWRSGGTLDDSSPLQDWFDSAKRLHQGVVESNRYQSMKLEASQHLGEICRRTERWSTYKDQPIRIFVSTHKDVELFQSDILQPVQVGAVRASAPIGHALRDCDGENISELNPMYCELTTQYWAWKNVDAEYYGFCHYRRYFDFNEIRHAENDFGEIMYDRIGSKAQQEFCLDDKRIAEAVRGYDVITTEFKDLREFPEDYSTPWEHYNNAPQLHIEDLELCMRILGEMYPDYVKDADEFLNGNKSCFCNMFIMRKDIFQDYCSWLFSILERFMEESDMGLYSREARRTPGHLAERLLNIYYNHHMRIRSGWKTKQLQCVHFINPERIYKVDPIFPRSGLPIVPIVLAADNSYVPMLTTTLQSVMANASDRYHYDVLILERGIGSDRKAIMRRFFSRYKNLSLRFYDVAPLVAGYDLKTNNEHIGVETYYRFLIQEILPFYDKVLYLDADLIIEGDVSELYSTDLGNDLLAAAHDIDYLGNLSMKDGERLRYSEEILGLKDPWGYFQAGVLLLNTRELRKLCSVQEWLEAVSGSEYIYDDQDVLNSHCQGRVSYLDYSWNVMIDCDGRIGRLFSLAPSDSYDAFLASRENPKIVHYAGYEKPWKMANCDEAVRYWGYARQTPFYEELVGMLSSDTKATLLCAAPARAVSEDSPVRKILDPVFPQGSRRRELAKAIGRAVRGR